MAGRHGDGEKRRDGAFKLAAGNLQLAGKKHPVYGIIAACCELSAACWILAPNSLLYALCPTKHPFHLTHGELPPEWTAVRAR
jgi:hypothetical protein